MTTNNLLIELGTEELPPKSLKSLATSFYDAIVSELTAAELTFANAKWFATPRRLAVYIEQLEGQQQDKVVEKRGPAVNLAFDESGEPSKAAQGWARSNGITVAEAERLVTNKGEWLLYKATQIGKNISDLLPGIVNKAVTKLPIPKPMRWGSSRTQFIRPVHTVTMMYGDQLINGEVLGVTASNKIQGHRFHHHGLFTLNNASDYEAELNAAHVIADFNKRRQLIVDGIEKAAQALNGTALLDDDLLDEVTALVEWPVTLVGSFSEDFLQVPPEPLIYSMKDHQKYFPVKGSNGELMAKFIFITNIESKDASQVVKGNEKVITPRLADAEFFYNTDKKQTLESRLDALSTVLFQKQLGTLKEKSARISAVAAQVAQLTETNTDMAARAGLLSKADLMTDMVLEFPEVQGTMGKYYALHDGEATDVAQALEDQYRPKFSGDTLPEGNVGAVVAIADKIDTLVGIFGINQAPKGDKDPFALRRAAIGLLRIIIEKKLSLDIKSLALLSVQSYGDKLSNDTVVDDVVNFVKGRYRAYYQEKGVAIDVIQAVLAVDANQPVDFDQRINAVSFFKSLPEATTLAAANKRVGNIIAKFDGELADSFNSELAVESAEMDLSKRFKGIEQTLAPLYESNDYQAILTALAELKQPVDEFFDSVMVMADDEQIKINRLTLLNDIRNSFYKVADISLLQ